MHPGGEKRSRQDQSRLCPVESAEAGCRGKEHLLRQQDNQGSALKREEGRQSADFARNSDRRRMYSV
jgi:hypothetical protein